MGRVCVGVSVSILVCVCYLVQPRHTEAMEAREAAADVTSEGATGGDTDTSSI